MKYPPLQGICEKAIKENRCTGCPRLEEHRFIGVWQCEYAEKPVQPNFGIQERLKL